MGDSTTARVRDLIALTPDWLSILTEQYAITAVSDGDVVSLKYNQHESPMHEPIVQECRGMVVHVPTGTILAHPYNKFWNHGEALAAEIDWSTARVLEKLDGSLITLYHNGGWCIASSGHPTAGGPYGEESRTFRDAFWETWTALGMRLPAAAEHICFMFEFCSNAHRIVCRHETPRIVLHGARNLATGAEIDRLGMWADEFGWELVKSYNITSAASALAAADSVDPIQTEGFVVVDAAFNRVKIKSPRYVALHHMKGEATPRRAIELWQTGETDEVLCHFPEFAPKILPVHDVLDRVSHQAYQALLAVRFNELLAGAPIDRKTFAAQVKDLPYSAACFRHFNDRHTVTRDDVVKTLRSQSLASLERIVESVGVEGGV
jgi:hypothetical protein